LIAVYASRYLFGAMLYFEIPAGICSSWLAPSMQLKHPRTCRPALRELVRNPKVVPWVRQGWTITGCPAENLSHSGDDERYKEKQRRTLSPTPGGGG